MCTKIRYFLDERPSAVRSRGAAKMWTDMCCCLVDLVVVTGIGEYAGILQLELAMSLHVETRARYVLQRYITFSG